MAFKMPGMSKAHKGAKVATAADAAALNSKAGDQVEVTKTFDFVRPPRHFESPLARFLARRVGAPLICTCNPPPLPLLAPPAARRPI